MARPGRWTVASRRRPYESRSEDSSPPRSLPGVRPSALTNRRMVSSVRFRCPSSSATECGLGVAVVETFRWMVTVLTGNT
jgi:hypothetical protein